MKDKLANKKIHRNVPVYFWLCLSEIKTDYAKEMLQSYTEDIRARRSKLKRVNETDETVGRVLDTVWACINL
jgi:hypothetical protein